MAPPVTCQSGWQKDSSDELGTTKRNESQIDWNRFLNIDLVTRAAEPFLQFIALKNHAVVVSINILILLLSIEIWYQKSLSCANFAHNAEFQFVCCA